MADKPTIATPDGSMVLRNVSWGRYELPVATVMENRARRSYGEQDLSTKIEDPSTSQAHLSFFRSALGEIHKLADADPSRTLKYDYQMPQVATAPAVAQTQVAAFTPASGPN